jgi:hypothetical protein
MPDGVSAPADGRPSRLTLNSDGRRHPVLNAMTLVTFVMGILAFALGLMKHDHLLATIIGIIAFCVGLLTQMLSATREQRIFIVAGCVAAFVGLGLGVGHGGFG